MNIIFSNFIPNKLVTFNDKGPPWMTTNLRDKINWKKVFIRVIYKKTKQIMIIFSYKMQYKKYQYQYPEGRIPQSASPDTK